MLELQLESERATLAFARSFADLLEGGDVVGLEGGLGAGKTTLTCSPPIRSAKYCSG